MIAKVSLIKQMWWGLLRLHESWPRVLIRDGLMKLSCDGYPQIRLKMAWSEQRKWEPDFISSVASSHLMA